MPRSLALFLTALSALITFHTAVPVLAADPVEVEISGVEGDALQNVKQALTLPYGLVSNGKVDRLWLERFTAQAKEKAKEALEPFGYYNAKVNTTIREFEGQYRLEVRVEPGAPVLVTERRVTLHGAGAKEASLLQLVDAFPLAPGDILLQPRYEQAKGRLRSHAIDLGYLDADFPLHEIHLDPVASTARIALALDTGERYYFDGVTIEGAEKYPDTFLRRYLAFRSGEPFSYASLGETQLNYTNAERFKEVLVTPEKEKATDFRVPVRIKLTPAKRRTLRPGVGYGTDTGARFTIRYRDLDLFRQGHEFDSTLYMAQQLQGLAARYVIPSPRDIKTSTALQLNLQREDVTSYVSRLIALELDRNRSLGKGRVGTAYLRLQEEDFTIGTENSGSRLVLPGLRLSEDRFDSMIRPTAGYRYQLELRGTHTYIGSDVGLVQFIAQGMYIMPLPWRLSLRVRASGAGSILADPLQDVPPSLRFFAGGDQSVRGYSYKSLGPRDASGEVVGGRDLFTASGELERALFEKWGVSVFYDVGNAYNDITRMDLKSAVGVGAHYYTPVGAVNVSVAQRVGPMRPAIYVHFSVGFEL